jgi:hypothetical protein
MLKMMFTFVGKVIFDGMINKQGKEIDCRQGTATDIQIHPNDREGFLNYEICYAEGRNQHFTNIKEIQVTTEKWIFVHEDGSKSYIRKA